MKIVVTIPAYNEEETIGNVISDIDEVMCDTGHDYVINVVNDGSTDNTAEVAKKIGANVYSHPYNYGLAETFKTEMDMALKEGADIIVHIDADAQYQSKDIPKLIAPIIRGESDLVIGSRFLGTIEKMSLIKKLGNMAFSRVISQITGVKITDAQSGFRAFTSDLAEKVKISSTHTYTQEMIIRAKKEKFRIKEVPIHFVKRQSGNSRLISSPFEYAFKAWVNIFRVYRDYAPLKFFGLIGGGLICLGLITGAYILYIVFSNLGTLDEKIPTVILCFLLLTSGIQIVLFGFLADKIGEAR